MSYGQEGFLLDLSLRFQSQLVLVCKCLSYLHYVIFTRMRSRYLLYAFNLYGQILALIHSENQAGQLLV